jgi:hypothetical protein
VVRLGYDLFQEMRFLLTAGQPVQNAHIPTLDIHVSMLRNFILQEGIPLLELGPVPAGYDFSVCLSHDIDFIGIKNHKFDHTMWGFLYRSTAGAVQNLFRRRISLRRLFQSWRAALSIPFVHLGWAKDFWEPFEWYLRVERNLPATYFLIPFKNREGGHVPGRHASRRAASYDVGDLSHWVGKLQRNGCELAVHGIDAWHSVEKGCEELTRIANLTGQHGAGIRMHWLLSDEKTASVLDQAGYSYDCTAGYNDTIGYRNGTSQVFRPIGAKTLLEMPLHIQDGALFRRENLDLSDSEAQKRCAEFIHNARTLGGIVTLLWHDRSHAPERFWGDFYVKLVQDLRTSNAWFGTAGQIVAWFRKRRQVRFEYMETSGAVRCSVDDQSDWTPSLNLRVYRSASDTGPFPHYGLRQHTFDDIPWNFKTAILFDASLNPVSEGSLKVSTIS